MIAKTCSLDGRCEATRMDATIDALREMLLVNFGLLSAPGGLKSFFFEKHGINADTHTRTSTYSYKHTHAHPIPMSTSER
jgi:hypothetical protein